MKKILLLIIFVFSFSLVGCNFFPEKEDTKDYGLNTITDASELNNLLKNSVSYDYRFMLESTSDDSVLYSASPHTDLGYQSTDYTKTNVQVEGVDEEDIIKTDGSRIYSITRDRLQVVNLLGEGKMELLLNEKLKTDVSEENYGSYTYYSGLYITDDYLVVIGQRYSYSIYNYKGDNPVDENSDDKVTNEYVPYFYYNYTIMSIVQTYDKESLKKVDTYEVSGYLQGSRLIDDKLYLISNHYVNSYLINDDYDIRPWYKHNTEINYFEYDSIKFITDAVHQSFTVISTIYLDPDEITIDKNVFLGASYWGQIYVSTSSIYFAGDYTYRNILGNYEQEGMLISFQFSKSGKVFFGGCAVYRGYIINQFAIDEYDGYIRVATTEGWGEKVVNRLYIFERTLVEDSYKLKTISLLDKGIGKPGERIESVRFNKEIATIVTFLRTDPLYTIDLSDPYNPLIAGELEIPGYSTYQHPWGDNLIIGIGFDANENGVTTGMKLALYDISDIENPIEVGKSFIIDNNSGWTYSEATYNHKAIMIDITRNCFGFALNKRYMASSQSLGNDFIVFDVDETRDQPIQIKYSVSHESYFYSYTNIISIFYRYDNYKIQRGFRIDDYLYVISNEVVTSHYLLGDETAVDVIVFKNFLVSE